QHHDSSVEIRAGKRRHFALPNAAAVPRATALRRCESVPAAFSGHLRGSVMNPTFITPATLNPASTSCDWTGSISASLLLSRTTMPIRAPGLTFRALRKYATSSTDETLAPSSERSAESETVIPERESFTRA